MNVGYIRVSTQEQNTARQDAALDFCDVIFEEKISGKNMKRPQLKEMLSSLREGDVVWITELSRLGRSNIDLLTIVEEIQKKGATLKSMKENIDLSSATGVFTFQIFSAMAEFERSMIRERQREGIDQALEQVRRGEREGWGAKIQHPISDKDFQDYYNGKYKQAEFLKKFEISKTAFYDRYRKWRKEHGY